jgi:2-dehydropantoate 2-reductase
MRILVVGAGAIGGYFGGRMLQAGRDVTFLVRPRRAAELADAGLVIKSPNGDVTLKNPPTVQANKLTEKFDVVLLSCKAFDLEDAIKSFAPAVGPQTAIIPLLNGMLHLDVLDSKFGRERVLGGLCAIAATLNEHREVVQLNPMQSLGGQRTYRAGDVGEMGVPRHARGLDLPDANVDRQYPGLAWRQGFYPWHVG